MSDRISVYAPQVLAVLRIVAALLYFEAGTMMLFNFPTPTFQMPELTPLLLVAANLEVVGGLLLLLGFLTRPVAFILSGMMAVAYWGFHFPTNPWPANNMGGEAILFCFVFLYLVFAGPGAWSVDGAIASRRLG